MSLQAYYWLQKLNFYNSTDDFASNSKPKGKGINNSMHYFEHINLRTFLTIYGNRYKVGNGTQIVIPIFHTKNFPLTGRFIAYNDCYEKIINNFRK